MEELLAKLRGREPLRAALDSLRGLPRESYPDSQWEVVEALVGLLPVAVGHLRGAFVQAGEVDFVEVMLGAIEALGAEGTGAGGAETIGYRIRHLLVDEFQDTSFNQNRLLEGITAEWRPGDGRTLFLVGDPMQSIYGFREAQVGLYLQARRRGIGAVALEPLTLTVNFRSRAGIVEWLNGAFPQVFPEVEDVQAGAVAYTAASPFRSAGAGPAVAVHPLIGRDDPEEARQVVGLVQDARARNPSGTVAILVRSRPHLAAIIPALRDAGLKFRAVEIAGLAHRPVVQDLLTLTRALGHPADRVAWLALLRAPWCGLELADLLLLVGEEAAAPVWDRMIQDLPGLSPEGRIRLERVRDALRPAMEERGRRPPRRLVEGVWLALGGPAGLGDAALADAAAFLDLLSGMEKGEAEWEQLADKVKTLYAQPDLTADESLQVMTIHKAKGLEFDTVILPGLGRRPARDEARLLMWSERPRRGKNQTDFVLAPIVEKGSHPDPTYEYLRRLADVRQGLEAGRLIYVAATRPREQLHLLGHAEASAEGVRLPAKGTLLRMLWPVVQGPFEEAWRAREGASRGADTAAADTVDTATAVTATATGAAELPPASLLRLPADWVCPKAPPELSDPAAEQGAAAAEADGHETLDFLWAGEAIRHVGTVVHRALQGIAETGVAAWNPERVGKLRDRFRAQLRRLGVSAVELEDAADKVEAALQGALTDERGAWVLGDHAEAENELALTAVDEGHPVRLQVDRTFVAEGVRWIIDYKTGSHTGGELEAFLASEQVRYQAQLERYARVLKKYDPEKPIRLGLYFPLLRAWREWEPGELSGSVPGG